MSDAKHTPPCKLKYSLTQGVFVVMQGYDFAAVCNSQDLLWEWLDGCDRKTVSDVRIFLAGLDEIFADMADLGLV